MDKLLTRAHEQFLLQMISLVEVESDRPQMTMMCPREMITSLQPSEESRG